MNVFVRLLVSFSPVKNTRSSHWLSLAVWCVKIHSSRSVSSLSGALFSLFFVVGWSPFPSANTWAWEVKTHEELTEESIKIKEQTLSAYLVENLGLEGGLNESLPGGTPRELMKVGSNAEDDNGRFFNHFHEPVSNRGLLEGAFDSSIDWSLRPKGEQGIRGNWSWNDAREYYYKALTSPAKSDRDTYWGKTFRALGQVMHLLQDAANPSHVRDDLHPFNDGLHDYMEKRSVGSYVSSGIVSPDPSILEQAGAIRSEPFSNLFDRDIYRGGNPGSTLANDVGITEYTNANFYSDDTIGSQSGSASAYPNVSELVPATTIPFGVQYLTLPRLGSPTELKARVAKYTGNQALAKYKLGHLQLDFLAQLQLDDLVYEAYSINLIPRAVGYSAAVLDYFFRGDLRIQGSGQCYEPGLDATQFWVDFTPAHPSHYQGGQGFTLYFQDSNGLWVAEDFIPVREGSMRLTGGYTGSPSTVRLAVVYDGPLGPAGAVEARGIVAKAQKITGFIDSCLQ